jgi:glutamate-ammonia-ligase adenylyltransferase
LSARLEARLREALAGSPLAARVALIADPFIVRRGDDSAAASLDGPRLLGLARALVTNLEAARYLAHRPLLLERMASADGETLRTRGEELDAAASATPDDLEGALDALRLLRRDETLLAAALELGGLVTFPAVSVFLSLLAEAILKETLARARRSVHERESAGTLAVLGMGKVGGREFTFHSDLDLIFLCGGGVDVVVQASRVAQRLISYLTTRTGAGVAYAVDSRLRPSGNQGLLVTTLDSFARYQRDDAQTWEHLALMRARAIAGDQASGEGTLVAVRAALAERRLAPWSEVADMRFKVEAQRAREERGRIAFKTGPGGLMDVDFLAAGATLERGAQAPIPALPSNPSLLRAMAPGPATEKLLEAYACLRRVEGCARWVLGRATDVIEPETESFESIAALALPGGAAADLATHVAEARRAIRSAFRAVIEGGTIAALQRASLGK